MMGAGKTTIGKLLAEKTGRKFIDTDKLIEKRLGRPISQFFKLYGEQAFRDHETAVIKSLTNGSFVVATGGGVNRRNENEDHLLSIGRVIYLRSEPSELIRRLQARKQKRPLLSSDDWEEKLVSILQSRAERYEMANVTVDVDDVDQDEIVERVLVAIEESK